MSHKYKNILQWKTLLLHLNGHIRLSKLEEIENKFLVRLNQLHTLSNDKTYFRKTKVPDKFRIDTEKVT